MKCFVNLPDNLITKLSILGCTLKVRRLVRETNNLLALDCENTPEIQSIHIWNLQNNSGTWVDYTNFVKEYFSFKRPKDRHFLVSSKLLRKRKVLFLNFSPLISADIWMFITENMY